MKLWGQPTKGRSKEPSQPSQKEGSTTNVRDTCDTCDGSTHTEEEKVTKVPEKTVTKVTTAKDADIKGFLDTLDSLWASVLLKPEGSERAGLVQIVGDLVANICKQFNCEAIWPELGDEFDPHFHGCDVVRVGPVDKILELQRIGFQYPDGRFLRPAQVVVGVAVESKQPTPDAPNPTDKQNMPDSTPTTGRREAVLGMTVEKAFELWRAAGKPIIYLGPGENAGVNLPELDILLSNPKVLERHLEAVRTWLKKRTSKLGEPGQ